jgi:hypothetical protein
MMFTRSEVPVTDVLQDAKGHAALDIHVWLYGFWNLPALFHNHSSVLFNYSGIKSLYQSDMRLCDFNDIYWCYGLNVSCMGRRMGKEVQFYSHLCMKQQIWQFFCFPSWNKILLYLHSFFIIISLLLYCRVYECDYSRDLDWWMAL